MDNEDEGVVGDDIDQRYIVPGLARGLTILQLFNAAQTAMTLAELAEKAGLSRSSAYRLVYTLEKEGFLSRDADTKRYALTSRAMGLGYAFLAARPLVEIVHPFLRRISEATGVAAHLVELDGIDAVYLARMAPAARVISNLQVGTRLPAHATVSGRMLLAGLSPEELRVLHPRMKKMYPAHPPLAVDDLLTRAAEDAARGYVMDDSTFDPGIRSFAAPVKNGAGRTVGALNAIGPTQIMTDLGGESALDSVIGAEARALSHTLGWK